MMNKEKQSTNPHDIKIQLLIQNRHNPHLHQIFGWSFPDHPQIWKRKEKVSLYHDSAQTEEPNQLKSFCAGIINIEDEMDPDKRKVHGKKVFN